MNCHSKEGTAKGELLWKVKESSKSIQAFLSCLLQVFLLITPSMEANNMPVVFLSNFFLVE